MAAAHLLTLADAFAECPGNLNLEGFGLTSIVPTGWAKPDAFVGLQVSSTGDELAPALGSRAYFAQSCEAGVYDHTKYLALNLLGKRMRYTTDMSDLGCGCNAAFYLTSMHQNNQPSECSDYYCDANNVCGQSCAEIDIQEGNKFSWHSTLHGKVDHNGLGKGIGGGGAGWSGPRDWSTAEYGPGGSCIDTSKPFQVEVAFPADANCQLVGMEVTLSQVARSDCELKLSIDNYAEMPEMSMALAAGMTPIVSYWNSADMLWMDGKGADGQGPCAADRPHDCPKRAKFSNFSVAAIQGDSCKAKLTDQKPADAHAPKTNATTQERTTRTTTTATLVVSEHVAAADTESVGHVAQCFLLGMLAGSVFVGIVAMTRGYMRSKQTPVTQRTLHRSMTDCNSLISLAFVAEQQDRNLQHL